MTKRLISIAAAVVALLCATPDVMAGDQPVQLAQMAERLSRDRLGDIEPGTYLAGDNLKFSIDRGDGYFLFRMDGSPEIFVLHSEAASLGGRVLKYDSGETALRVAGWGGITLYTDSSPSGLPVVRTGESTPPRRTNVSPAEIQKAAKDEAQRINTIRGLHMSFDADWKRLSANADLRALALDALENASRGIERFTANAVGRQEVSRRIGAVLMTTGLRPSVSMRGRTLLATFNPANGFEGRASSRAFAKAMDEMFANQRLH
ncbi:MAG: DUF4908 domain-containing protein [Alphaproteobacteria bacterium]|nr:DUF4908 domain-containing protein [Alphaproteobacteria bacterium]